MDYTQTISIKTKNAAEEVGYDFFPIEQSNVLGEGVNTCTVEMLHDWIKSNYKMYIETMYSDMYKWSYSLRWCQGYGVKTLWEGEFLYIDSESNFNTEEIAFDEGLQRALLEIKNEESD